MTAWPLGAQRSPTAVHAHRAEPARVVGDGEASESPAAAAFLAAARAGTARYRDLPAAIADGYRRVGGELPSMGEHWLHNGRALADTLDPAAPPILVYARVAGRPVLAGVAYTRFLAPHAPYPDFPPGRPHAWHDHNGRVDEEVLPLGHLGSPGATRAAMRVAVMHAWIGVSNPAGVWAPNNWGLAYVRVGLPPDAGPAGADARALALAAGGDDYYLQAILSVGALSEAEEARVRAVIASHTVRAVALSSRLAERLRGGAPRAEMPAEIAALAALWNSMWSDIASAVRPEAWARLAPLRAALAAAPT